MQYFVFLHTVTFLSRLCSDFISIISILFFRFTFFFLHFHLLEVIISHTFFILLSHIVLLMTFHPS